MHKINLKGGYYEIGNQYGQILKKSGFKPPPASEKKLEFVKKCEQIIRQKSPQLLRELRGVSEGGKFDAHLINSLALTLDGSSSCTVFAISGKYTLTGKPIFARNYDFLHSFKRYSELYLTHPEKASKSIGCSDIFVGREDGLNEFGLAVGETYVGYFHKQPGFIFPLAIRTVLDKCHNVDEALKFLVSIPHQRNVNFLLADKQGKIAIIESALKKVRVTNCEDTGIITNHFLSSDMIQYQPPKTVSESSQKRYKNFQTWFKSIKKPISIKDVKQFLSDSQKGACQIDNIDPDWPEPICTLWSWVAELGDFKIHLAEDLTGRVIYEEIEN